jgi:hypothetical protein
VWGRKRAMEMPSYREDERERERGVLWVEKGYLGDYWAKSPICPFERSKIFFSLDESPV